MDLETRYNPEIKSPYHMSVEHVARDLRWCNPSQEAALRHLLSTRPKASWCYLGVYLLDPDLTRVPRQSNHRLIPHVYNTHWLAGLFCPAISIKSATVLQGIEYYGRTQFHCYYTDPDCLLKADVWIENIELNG